MAIYMSDYYNENDSRYYYGYGSYPTPPQPPQRPVQPPQAPPMYSGYNPPPVPPMPAAPPQQLNIPPVPQAPAAPAAPAATPAPQSPPPAPVRSDSQFVDAQRAMNSSPYRIPNTPPVIKTQEDKKEKDSDSKSSTPPKQPMGPGLKALLIIIVTFLFVSLAGFIAYLSMFPETQQGFVPSTEETSATESADSGDYDFDYDDDAESPTAPTGSYEESDASDKTNKDYKGLTLNKKPKKVTSDKKGSSYAFSQVEKSVVGVIAYVDGQEGTATSYTNMGTGVIITSNGYIVTNAHLVDYSRTAYKYKVVTNNKKEYKAGIVGYDSRSDLAVLKVDAKDLTPASFGDSSQIEVTEDVIVVGNPLSLNYQNSVTKGIVSAVDRQVSITNNVKCIQTDAAINPGNSGGPLCNMYGQVIGITNSKIALDDYEGMGFAIPSKLVKSISDDIIKYSYVQGRVKIGIMGEVEYMNFSTYETAICVKEVIKDGPMDGSGVKVGDFITKFEGKKISNFADIYDALENYRAGEKVTVTVYRPDEDKEYEFKIVLEADEF